MPLTSSIEHNRVTGTDGAVLGTVERVLFHPSEPRVVGVMVRPPAAMMVVTLPETFLPLSSLEVHDGGVHVDMKKLPSQRKGADALGYDPDTTVIYTSMPLVSPTGRTIGIVGDVEFDAESGSIARVIAAGGVVADVAHGRLEVPGALVTGYADGGVHVTAEAHELDTTGGLAKTAATTVVAVAATANEVGEKAGEAIVSAAGATGRAIKSVADADVVGKTAKRVKSTWADTLKAFREGMDD